MRPKRKATERSGDHNDGMLPCPPVHQTIGNPNDKKEPLCRRKTFYVHDQWSGGSETHMSGHMYVESLEPEAVSQPYPLILIHGDHHSGKIWLDKPDGNRGWASYFLEQGYHVYLVDLPGAGRSGKHPTVVGGNLSKPSFVNPLMVEQELTRPAKYSAHQNGAWETVCLHSQWPGTGERGDPVFTQYMASVTVIERNRWERQTQAQEALGALLDRTGKAILIGEGTGCIMAWLTTDVKYELVAAVVSIEPTGPPFGSAKERGLYSHRTTFDPGVREWGLSDIPLTYDPPLLMPEAMFSDITMDTAMGSTRSALFSLFEYTNPEDPRKSCLLQNPIDIADSAEAHGESVPSKVACHQLLHLKKVPHAVITAQASSHSVYDWATVNFMIQAGLRVTWIRLEHLHILGNGRLMFLEKNSDDIAQVIHKWMMLVPDVKQLVLLPGHGPAHVPMPEPPSET